MNDDTGDGRGRLRRPGLRWAGVPAAVAGIALLAAACGVSSPPLTATQVRYQKDLAYAQCMRSHGQPSFPDPTSQGGFKFSDGLPSGPAYQSAYTACKKVLPNGSVVTAAQLRRLMGTALKFAECMRAHGIANFPDPTMSNGTISIAIPQGSGTDTSSPQFLAAQQACRSLEAAGGGSS
jgi:hypothetical protein